MRLPDCSVPAISPFAGTQTTFSCCCRTPTKHRLRAFADGVRSALALVRLPHALVVSVTVGTAEMTAGERLQDTIGRADELVYRAKAAGRNLRGEGASLRPDNARLGPGRA